jgi:hypothetical protein
MAQQQTEVVSYNKDDPSNLVTQMVHAFDWLTSVEKLWQCAVVECEKYDDSLDSFISLIVTDKSQERAVEIAKGDFMSATIWRAKPHVALSMVRISPARALTHRMIVDGMSRPHLQQAIERQLDDCIWMLIDLGCDILERRQSPGINLDGETALHAAARRYPEILPVLLEKVQNSTSPPRSAEDMTKILEAQNAGGFDVLSQAVVEGSEESNGIVDILRRKYDVNLDRMVTLEKAPMQMTLTCSMMIRVIRHETVPISQLRYLLDNLQPEPRFQLDTDTRDTLLTFLASEAPREFAFFLLYAARRACRNKQCHRLLRRQL